MAKCPRCETPDAYVGLLLTKCRNPFCSAYDENYMRKRVEHHAKKFLEESKKAKEEASEKQKREPTDTDPDQLAFPYVSGWDYDPFD